MQFGPQTRLFVLYPLIPWAGVMAVGYAVGPVFKLDRRTSERLLIAVGLAVTAGFIVLRAAMFLRRSGAVECAGQLVRNGAVVPQLREVSAVAQFL